MVNPDRMGPVKLGDVGQDPFVQYYKRNYFLPQAEIVDRTTDEGRLVLQTADRLEGLVGAPRQHLDVLVPGYTRGVWAPEMHFDPIERRWGMYFAACDGRNENHRMFVAFSRDANPMGPYERAQRIAVPGMDWFGIDMTVFWWNRKRYAGWSGWPSPDAGFPQNLYIARMRDAWNLEEPVVCISEPKHDWERSVKPINEGPQVVEPPRRQTTQTLKLAFSADASWTPEYKLGELTLDPEGDPLNLWCWKKGKLPLMDQHSIGLPGPGHGNFLGRHKGEPTYIFHAKTSIEEGWSDRAIYGVRYGLDNRGQLTFG